MRFHADGSIGFPAVFFGIERMLKLTRRLVSVVESPVENQSSGNGNRQSAGSMKSQRLKSEPVLNAIGVSDVPGGCDPPVEPPPFPEPVLQTVVSAFSERLARTPLPGLPPSFLIGNADTTSCCLPHAASVCFPAEFRYMWIVVV